MENSLLMARILYIIMWIVFIFLITILISTICSYFVIEVTKYTITSEKIPPSFDGYKILQLSDLHDISYGKNNSKLIKKIEEVTPDIIVMTGDMVNSDTKSFDKFYSFAKEISKNYKCYYIMGNHEMRLPNKSQSEINRKLTSLGINILSNRKTTISNEYDSITLYGLHQPISTYKNALKNNKEADFSLKDMQRTLSLTNDNTFNILLSHSPFDFDIFAEWGADLVLSGHVHGGLIRLPFLGGLLSPERTFFPKYDSGEYSIGDSTMIVSRGLGNGTINLRVFNNPEICVIELKSM